MNKLKDKQAKVKSLPVKIGRKIKSLFKFHHVPLPHHHKHKAPETLPFIVTTATCTPPVFPSLDVARDIVHTLPTSENGKDSFIQSDLGDSDSSRETAVTSDQSSQSSVADTSDEFSHSQDVSFATAMSSLPEDKESGELRQEESGGMSVSVDEPLPTSSESIPNSPLVVYVEPEVPDPFLIDDEDDPESDNDEEANAAATVSESQQTIIPAHEISLTSEPIPSLPMVPPPNINKDVPPPPRPDSESDEDQVPDLYLPGLILPTMFLPIPNVRRSFSSNYLTWWLSRSLMYHTCTRRIR
jgi:hypothetical protein